MKDVSKLGLGTIGVLLMCFGVVSFANAGGQKQFVPNNRNFWNDSINWTTNFGPAYRDVVINKGQFLPCATAFALCFHSGPEPLPCKLDKDGRSAQCTCDILTGTNYTVMNSILNYKVYLQTLSQCGSDGSNCTTTGSAPVCSDLNGGKLIPGAKVISTFDPSTQGMFANALDGDNTIFKTCPKGPYAGCMTAPCKLTKSGQAVCKCPVFYGRFQLVNNTAACDLGDGLVNSADYSPLLDSDPNQ